MSLFGTQPGNTEQGNNYLHSFKAGKCVMDDKNIVTPETEKGLVYLYKDDGMVNFRWKNRSTNTPDEAMYLFAGDVEFKKCKSCEKGRVFYLHFKDAKNYKFFWMQDKDDAKDEENCRKVNDVINGVTSTTTSSVPETPQIAIDADDMMALNSLDPEERAQMLAMLGVSNFPTDATTTPAPTQTPGAPPPVVRTSTSQDPPAPTPTTTAPTTTSSAKPIQFTTETLQKVMAGMSATLQAQKQENALSLTDVLTPEKLKPMIEDKAFVEAMVPLLPEGQQTVDALKDNVSSPQYAQALASFSAALSSDDAVGMMTQFGVDPAVVQEGGGGAAGLLYAIQKQVDAENSAMDVDEKESTA